MINRMIIKIFTIMNQTVDVFIKNHRVAWGQYDFVIGEGIYCNGKYKKTRAQQTKNRCALKLLCYRERSCSIRQMDTDV